MFHLLYNTNTKCLLFATSLICSLYQYSNCDKIKYKNRNRSITKQVIVVPPRSTYVLKLDTTFCLIPCSYYSCPENFYGIQINSGDVLLFDKQCQSIFQSGTRVDIINIFSDSELIMYCFSIKNSLL